MTGTPSVLASSIVTGVPSYSEKSTSASHRASRGHGFSIYPVSVTHGPRPSASRRRRISSNSGPLPAKYPRNAQPRFFSSAAISSSRS